MELNFYAGDFPISYPGVYTNLDIIIA